MMVGTTWFHLKNLSIFVALQIDLPFILASAEIRRIQPTPGNVPQGSVGIFFTSILFKNYRVFEPQVSQCMRTIVVASGINGDRINWWSRKIRDESKCCSSIRKIETNNDSEKQYRKKMHHFLKGKK